jgi:hypothetical protein
MVDLGRVGQLLSIYNIIRYEGSIAYLNCSVYQGEEGSDKGIFVSLRKASRVKPHKFTG